MAQKTPKLPPQPPTPRGSSSQNPKNNGNWWQRNLGSLIMLIVGIIFVYAFIGGDVWNMDEKKPINELARLISEEKVKKVELLGREVSVYEKDMKDTDLPIKYTIPSGTTFFEAMEGLGVEKEKIAAVEVQEKDPPISRTILELLPNLLFLLLMGIMAFVIIRQIGGSGGAFSFGKSRAKLFDGKGAYDKEKERSISFDDVAGIEEAKQELEEIVQFLKHPKKFTDMGARIPHGVLLIGPPGTGKTLLAKAVAGEAGVPFYSMSGSEFVEMFVGVGASRARDLFDQAKKTAPCIIFIDEIDAVGRQRGAGLGGGHDEREQTLNQILVEMDGFNARTTVIVMAATNRPDVLDPALLRPGRFDRQVTIYPPDIEGRKSILNVHIRDQVKKHLDKDIDLEVLAKQTAGFSGADLSNLVNEAAILAARGDRKTITMRDFEEAIDRVMAGPAKKGKRMSDKERKLTAYHEIGHAIVGKLLPNADAIHKISIISRGMMGGYTRFLPKDDKHNYSKAEFEDMIATLLGGYAAEALIFGETSTGPSNDIQRATSIARRMVTEYGMDDQFGPIAIANKDELLFLGKEISQKHDYSESLAARVDAAIQQIVHNQLKRAQQLLQDNQDILKAASEKLIKIETMDAKQFNAFFPKASKSTKATTTRKPATKKRTTTATKRGSTTTKKTPDKK